jgi:ADP-heptose:LPS heptosyltransferase
MRSNLHNMLISIRNYLFDGIVTLFPRVNCHQVGKASVLIIKLDAIGDFVLWLDAAAELRKIYPPDQFVLVLLGNALWTELAEQVPYFDEVIPIERKRFCYEYRYRFKIWKLLRSKSWTTVINPSYSRDFFYGDSVVRMSAAVERIGFQGDLIVQFAWQKRISNLWYNRLIPSSNEYLMELERNAEFIRGLDGRDFHARLPRLDIKNVLPKDFVVQDYFVMVPGAGASFRQWPLEFFSEIATRTSFEYGLSFVICGAPGEEILGEQLRQKLSCTVYDWAGKTSMRELVAIIRDARFVLGNESGVVHIAAAVGTPVFCIVGGGHWGRFIPYHIQNPSTSLYPVPIFHHMDCYCCNWKCNFKIANGRPFRCIEQVSVDEVWSAIECLLTSSKSIL